MNIKEYINSGILEAYLSGELNEVEMQEVDKLAGIYPVIQLELDELRSSINSYAKSTDQSPPSRILTNALKAIREEEKDRFINEIENSGKEVQFKRVNVVPVWSIAASILLVVSLGFNYIFYTEFKSVKDNYELAVYENENLSASVEQASQELQYASLKVAHFLNEDNIHVRMDGLDVAPESFANVFWNTKTNAVFISVDNLPEPPHGHQYQLWAIKPGLAPIDVGIFDHTQLIQELKVIKGNVQAFAVTLEEEGGSPIATVEKTFVKGFLKKS